MDDIEREDIGELLGELDELRAGRFVEHDAHPMDKMRLAELAGRAADFLDAQLRWRDSAEVVLGPLNVGELPALNVIAIASAKR